MSIELNIGCIVADNFYELDLIKEEAKSQGKTVKVLLRTTPGVEAHTHDYISTGQEDSKFGFDLASGQVEKAMETILSQPEIELLGFHCHIGSQIFDTTGFTMAVEKLYESIRKWQEKFDYT